ncbi:hypothetical protein [Pontivivens insulae]|uniref:Sulfotransferase domain-containing protein n=1 Tax=Pontivivens insulae TaxID=1639689 RepID=A0A2R8A9Y1_9RHOB|nr:hypothetical protein [Pontivivens insulae]RED12834.1 hypothetical protein DFR53_1965 [Pontivivens insulae]SPF28925.1 hypothetical protein POI8812_01228 [Pontivivens insulae]
MRLILHIGMHKTGSSAIQHVFSRNRRVLALTGLHYATGGRWPKHTPLFEASSHQNDHGIPHPVHGPVSDLLRALPDRGTVLVSAEGLSGPHPGHAAHFAGCRPEIVVVLRNPVDWAPAMHAQMVRSRTVREARTLADWVNDPMTKVHLDYAALIERWQQVGPVRVVPYEAAILPAFLTTAGLPKWIAALPGGRVRRNITPKAEVIEDLRRQNGGDAGSGPVPDLRALADIQRARVMALGHPAPWPSD